MRAVDLRATAGLLAVLATTAPAAVQAQERILVVERFDATIQVHTTGTVSVEERIRVGFTGSWNGIFRTIPVDYRTPQGFRYRLRLEDVEVTDDAGRALEFWNERERHYRRLKIAVPGARDAVRTVVIRYRVPNALRFWDEYDELYWNVTGDEWEVPILATSARVILPSETTGGRAASWTGGYGSRDNAATVRETEQGFYFRLDRPLQFRQGLTVAVAWDPGVVRRPTATDRALAFLQANALLLIPLLAFFGMFHLWASRGRDPRALPIAPCYEPPEGLTPSEVGTIVDDRPDMRDITAGLVDLAVRGYLRIEEVEVSAIMKLLGRRDYRFVRLRPPESWAELQPHEQTLLRGIFDAWSDTKLLSDLKQEFYVHLPAIKDALHESLVKHGVYTSRPDQVRQTYLVVAGIVAALGLFLFTPLLVDRFQVAPATALVTVLGTALPIGFFGYLMPARTGYGARLREQILGFAEFMERVESDRFERVVLTPEMFEKYLPYAMALGVERRWARAFSGLVTEPPSWYVGHWNGGFDTLHFSDSLSSLGSSAGATMASAPRSSGGSGFGGGGGFSGGGFGGGGGGGW